MLTSTSNRGMLGHGRRSDQVLDGASVSERSHGVRREGEVPPARSISATTSASLSLRARHQQRDPAGGGDLQRGGAADAADRPPVIKHPPTVDRGPPNERSRNKVGVEVALAQ